MNIGIFIYHGAEVLDFSGPFEVFATANRLATAAEPFQVFLLAEALGPVIARGGYRVLPAHDLTTHPPLDVVIVAGGVHDDVLQRQPVIDWLKAMAAEVSIVASVCTGAFLLAEAGLLNGLTATTHWEDQAGLGAHYPAVNVVPGRRWVDEGSVVTSGGISAGIDMSLHLVARLAGAALADKTARQMEFDWRC